MKAGGVKFKQEIEVSWRTNAALCCASEQPLCKVALLQPVVLKVWRIIH